MTGPNPYEPQQPPYHPQQYPPPPNQPQQYQPPHPLMPGNADPTYVPYSYTDPPNPDAVRQYQERQWRIPYEPNRSPIVLGFRIFLVVLFLAFVGQAVFSACSIITEQHRPNGIHPTQQTP